MGRPLSQRYWQQELYLNANENVVMALAWLPGMGDYEPCWIIRQLSTNSFELQGAYTTNLRGPATLVPSESDLNGPGTCYIGLYVQYDGGEGYFFSVKELNDNTAISFDGGEGLSIIQADGSTEINVPWQITNSTSQPGWGWIWTNAYVMAP